MAVTEVSAKYTGNEEKQLQERTIKANYDFGENLAEAIEKYGEEVVFSNYARQAKVSIQAYIRSQADQGKSDAEIQEALDSYKLGVVQRSGKSKVAKASELFANMSDEDKKAFIASLQAM